MERRRWIRSLGLLWLIAGVADHCQCLAEDAKPSEEAATPEANQTEGHPEMGGASATNYVNWVEMSLGGMKVDGNSAAFQQRHMIRDNPYGGLEDLHYQTQLGKGNYLQLDGRALIDNGDYAVRLEYVRQNVGFVRGGFKQYRTWYDGSGGFFPQTQSWYSLTNDELEMDRGEVWFEGGINIPKKPSFTFRFDHQFRDGQKDSTSWGLTHPYGAGPIRGLAPSIYDIDETRDIFSGDLKHTLGKTDLGLGLRYEIQDNNNERKTIQWPNETVQRYLTQKENVSLDLFNVHATSETRFNKTTRLTTGYSFTTVDTDTTGSRIYGNDFDVDYNRTLASALGFYSLAGGSELTEHLLNLNVMFTPLKAFSIIPSLRLEQQNIDSASSYIQTGGGTLATDTLMNSESSRELLDVAERLEMRYSGMTNWVFYGRGDWSEGSGDLREKGGGGLGLPILRYTEDERFTQKYTVGANWYPLRRVNTDVQYYHKVRDNDFDHLTDNTANDSDNRFPAYIIYHRFETDDINVRLTLRPLNNLTFVTRYDYQMSTVDTSPDSLSGMNELQTSEITSHMIGQNVTWVPWSRMYFQIGVNYVDSLTDTPANNYTKAILDFRNNYWDASSTVGFVLDNKTDLQLHYFFYQADNLEQASEYVPYGAGAEEHAVTVTLIRRLRDNIRLTLKYGFFDYTDDTSGGNNDYQAHLVYSSLQYRF